jgi:hypothetical protein
VLIVLDIQIRIQYKSYNTDVSVVICEVLNKKDPSYEFIGEC